MLSLETLKIEQIIKKGKEKAIYIPSTRKYHVFVATDLFDTLISCKLNKKNLNN